MSSAGLRLLLVHPVLLLPGHKKPETNLWFLPRDNDSTSLSATLPSFFFYQEEVGGTGEVGRGGGRGPLCRFPLQFSTKTLRCRGISEDGRGKKKIDPPFHSFSGAVATELGDWRHGQEEEEVDGDDRERQLEKDLGIFPKSPLASTSFSFWASTATFTLIPGSHSLFACTETRERLS